MDQLPEEYAAVLDFERAWWKFAGAKQAQIYATFRLSSTKYYQRLNAAIDHPAAPAHDPLLVNRLRRLRAARSQQRSARRLHGL